MIRRLVPAALILVAFAAAVGPLAAQAPRPLQITLLGTGNPRPNLERFGPSILVEANGQRLLIDAGRGAAQRTRRGACSGCVSSSRCAVPDRCSATLPITIGPSPRCRTCRS